MKQLSCIVCPVSELEARGLVRRAPMVRTAAGLLVPRRTFMRTAGWGIIGVTAAPFAMGNDGCEAIVQGILLAIEAAAKFFGLSDGISGSTSYQNGGNKSQVVETILELLFGDGAVDEGTINPNIPNDGQTHVAMWSGLQPDQSGEHSAQATANGDTKKSLPFTVT